MGGETESPKDEKSNKCLRKPGTKKHVVQGRRENRGKTLGFPLFRRQQQCRRVCELSAWTALWLSLGRARGSSLQTLLGPWMDVLLLWG